jgi:hemoglobin
LLLAAMLSITGAAADASLYQRIGGQAVVQAVTDDLIDHAAADPRTARSFAGVNMKRLKKHVGLYLCWISGGGCTWKGDSMKQAHAGLHISDAEMNRFVEQLIEALDRHGVGLREKNELLALLAPEKRDIVTKP